MGARAIGRATPRSSRRMTAEARLCECTRLSGHGTERHYTEESAAGRGCCRPRPRLDVRGAWRGEAGRGGARWARRAPPSPSRGPAQATCKVRASTHTAAGGRARGQSRRRSLSNSRTFPFPLPCVVLVLLRPVSARQHAAAVNINFGPASYSGQTTSVAGIEVATVFFHPSAAASLFHPWCPIASRGLRG